jgi:phenylpyruvate tautomerase PptA (4-oxalocrotonate tautomerase family)
MKFHIVMIDAAARGRNQQETIMPLSRIELRRGKPAEYRKAVMDGVYEAMRETFNVPEDDKFMLVSEYDEANFLYGHHYFDIARDDDLVLIQLTVSNTRTVEQKKALFARIAEKLGKNPGIRPQDVFINLVETGKENWSFGNGLAQHA